VTRADASRVHVAHADAWQAEGRLREQHGGGALDVRGLRLMASGLPQPQWNSADVMDADADLDAARAFYAARGAGWGVRVPPAIPWRHGRKLLTLRLMSLSPADFGPVPAPAGLEIVAAGAADLDAVLHVDATAFAEEPEVERAWLEPHLGAPEVDVALAVLDGEPVGTGYTVRTDDRAGPCLYLAGVAVLPAARRRGVGAALSSWLLERGLDAGAELAHLHADTPDAARVYARLGFEDAEGLDVYVEL
jgi:GNAT superfamily N-acetyltransferase